MGRQHKFNTKVLTMQVIFIINKFPFIPPEQLPIQVPSNQLHTNLFPPLIHDVVEGRMESLLSQEHVPDCSSQPLRFITPVVTSEVFDQEQCGQFCQGLFFDHCQDWRFENINSAVLITLGVTDVIGLVLIIVFLGI